MTFEVCCTSKLNSHDFFHMGLNALGAVLALEVSWLLLLLELYQPIKLRHRARLDGVHDIKVGHHGLVAGIA